MELYSQNYLRELESVHNAHTIGFGNKVKKIKEFEACMEKWKPRTLLDYGCGKGAMLQQLRQKYPFLHAIGYDPAVKIYSQKPKQKFDVVFCNDVLEHVEPLCLDNVLQFIEHHSKKYVWLRIDTQPANKILTDGRNAHLIIENEDWWRERLQNALQMKITKMYTNKKQRIDVELIHE
tara:strand:+ start:230 stop:763 length:534 start_codon:yes stop_codon:yes gene_type:complete